MKKTIALLAIMGGLFLSPYFATAHVAEDTSDQNITQEEFQDIRGVMIKMMTGEDLSTAEAGEMFEFMENHQDFQDTYFTPGMMSSGGFGSYGMGSYGMPMMSWSGGSSAIYWFCLATITIWFFAGILLIAFLLKKLNK